MSIRAIAMALPVLLAPLAAGAAPVTYTLVSTGGAGSLGSASFSQASVTFTGTADTANLQEFIGAPTIGAHGRLEYTNYSTMALTSLTAAIGGLPACRDIPRTAYDPVFV